MAKWFSSKYKHVNNARSLPSPLS